MRPVIRGSLGIRTLRMPSRVAADAPTFLLLHGIGFSHRSFSGLARELSLTGHVIAFDLPGFGANPRPDRPLSIEDTATAIGAQLAGMGTGPVIVVGHSMGAQFALELARQSPAAVSHVVLIGPVVDVSKRSLRAQAADLARDSALEPPRTQVMVAFDYLRCGIRWFLTESQFMRDYPTERAISAVPHPILLLRGEHDPLANAAWCETLARTAPDARAGSIPGARHNVPHSDPVATATAIVDFAAGEPGFTPPAG
ncbi:alpha/beta fold hydrolase [Glaciihabitans sp. dw_435]|uniref:alpha/beta fold hydrolase n=1 Tax=Glaciihabitans sp. dw_435 TaxID=2720081 RepID=UPI001BD2F46F|nr:alpha/beta fold hydrolase [Glaciihabitans sp. dw_435]